MINRDPDAPESAPARNGASEPTADTTAPTAVNGSAPSHADVRPEAVAPDGTSGDAHADTAATTADEALAPPDEPPTPLLASRGEWLFVDTWDAYDRAHAPLAAAEKRRSSLLMARELVETLALALIIFLGVRSVVQNFRVEGSSMDPTYASGQYVLVSKVLYAHVNPQLIGRFVPFFDSQEQTKHFFRGPKRGEVIVFHPPLPNSFDRDFIKRVIGLPGDHVQVRDGRVYVNGQQLGESYLRAAQTSCGGQWCDVRLGANEYYVMGDNRGNSSDSRVWGPVQANKIIGRTWLIYLPLSDFGRAPNQTPETLAANGDAAPAR